MDLLYFLLYILLKSNFISNKVDGLKVEKIIGGLEIHRAQFKYVAALIYKRPGLPDINPCTGSILDDWHIITVAHCFYNKALGRLRNSSFYIAAGLPSINTPTEVAKYIAVDTVTIHRSYNPNGPDTYYKKGNIAIVKLKASLKLAEQRGAMSYIAVRAKEIPAESQTYLVAGYGWYIVEVVIGEVNGRTDYIQLGQSDGRLRYGRANKLNNSACRDIIKNDIAEGNMCASLIRINSDHPVGICQGDSGAPLVFNNLLEGIAINGFLSCDEAYFPGIYVNLVHYKSFIDKAINNYLTPEMYIVQLQQRRHNQFEFVELFNAAAQYNL